MVHAADRDDRREQVAQLLLVEAAGEEFDIAGFAEHVDEVELLVAGVLEVGELLGEHHGVRVAVAVDQVTGLRG